MYPSMLQMHGRANHRIRNLNFDAGLVNGRRGIVRAIDSCVVDVGVLLPGAPLVKVPRIVYEVAETALPSTVRRQFPVRVCYPITISTSVTESNA